MAASLPRWAMAVFPFSLSGVVRTCVNHPGRCGLASAIRVGIQQLRGDGSVIVRKRCHTRRGLSPSQLVRHRQV